VVDHGSVPVDLRGEVCHGDHSEGVVSQRECAEGLYQPTVSVLMPCFNEGKTVYETIESISKSNYPAEKFEVIAQDDCSVDDSYEWMLKAQRDFTNIRIRTGRNVANR
jgi:cellulose synthase/poly-beta-1,6-N-acetylglucosamine synthase-like glycosyltransferase